MSIIHSKGIKSSGNIVKVCIKACSKIAGTDSGFTFNACIVQYNTIEI